MERPQVVVDPFTIVSFSSCSVPLISSVVVREVGHPTGHRRDLIHFWVENKRKINNVIRTV